MNRQSSDLTLSSFYERVHVEVGDSLHHAAAPSDSPADQPTQHKQVTCEYQ